MIRRRAIGAAVVILAAAPAGCSVSVTNSEPPPVTTTPKVGYAAPASNRAGDPAPADANTVDGETDEQAWKSVSAELGKPGQLKDRVYRVVFPRDDLEVTVEGNDVPAAAGIESEFRFWRCPCGRINVTGQFVVADYEANDVIDALREGRIEVASVGPLLLHEKPRLLLVRFFGENHHAAKLAKALRKALSWTGKERMAPQKID